MDCDPTSGLRVADLGIAQKRRKKWLDEETVPLFFEAIALGRMLAGDVSQEEGLSIQVRLGLGALVYVPVRSQSLISATVKELNLDPTPGEPPTWTIPASRIKKGEEAQVMPLPPTA